MKELEIRGVVGWDTTAQEFVKQFKEACLTDDSIRVNISSPGGSVYQGFEIHNVIKEYEQNGKNIELINQSLSGSIATVIMCAIPRNSKSSKVKMQKNAMYFIHMPSGFSFGDEDEMRLEAEVLSKIGDLGSAIYADRTGLTPEFCFSIMKENAWFTAEECLTLGFVDEIIDGGKKAEPIKLRSYSKFYINAPQQIMGILEFENNNHIIKPIAQQINPAINLNQNKKEILENQWKKFLNFLG